MTCYLGFGSECAGKENTRNCPPLDGQGLTARPGWAGVGMAPVPWTNTPYPTPWRGVATRSPARRRASTVDPGGLFWYRSRAMGDFGDPRQPHGHPRPGNFRFRLIKFDD